MKIIKLDAIDSTNSFLKELAHNSPLEDYTIVVAKSQTSGRGQMNASWVSKPNKNLTFSVLKQMKNLLIEHQSYLNFAVSLGIFKVLEELSVPNLTIKWPNDIMSGNKKICGILLETTFHRKKIKNTVMGIGLNVNQKNFPKNIPQASSLFKILGEEFDLEKLLVNLTKSIQLQIDKLEHHRFDLIHQEYLKNLYKKNVPTAFKSEHTQSIFMGIIKEVSRLGNLRIQLEDDSIVEFGIKEISIARV